jgi:hypothetical protein
MNIHPVGSELSHVQDGQTDTTKLIVTFLNSANAPLFPLENRTSDPKPFRPQHSHYTDCATPAPILKLYLCITSHSARMAMAILVTSAFTPIHTRPHPSITVLTKLSWHLSGPYMEPKYLF